MHIITALIDFTDTSKKAYDYALFLARKQKAKINLLHVGSPLDEHPEHLEERMTKFTGVDSSGVDYSLSVGEGDFRKIIPDLLAHSHSDFVVIGTHGDPGQNPTIFGSEALKLSQSIDTSALVIQDGSPEPKAFEKMLFPIGPHDDFHQKIDLAIEWVKLFGTKINVFALADESGEVSDDIKRNLQLTVDSFKKAGVDYTETVRPTKVYSVGYSREIIAEAQATQCDLIMSMAHPSRENSYFGNVDKSQLLFNSAGIPVLSVMNDKEA